MSNRKGTPKPPEHPVDIDGIAAIVEELKPEYRENFRVLVSRLFENAQYGKYGTCEGGKSHLSLDGARQTVLAMVLLTDGEILR